MPNFYIFSTTISSDPKFIKLNRHMKLSELIASINVKLRGHYSYYGITFNSSGISCYFSQVRRALHKWINHRGGKRKWNWISFSLLVDKWKPLVKPLIKHSYV